MADEYSKFTITSKKDRYSHGYDIPDYERDMRAIVNQAVKSALSEGGYFKTSSRVVDKTTGETKLDIYVHTADAKVVEDSIKNELNKLTFRDSKGRVTQRPKYKIDTDTLTDKEQKIIAKEERAQDRGEGEVSRFNRGTFLKIVGLLTSILAVARRILSSVMAFSTQTARDFITAHNLGISYESARNYRHVETTHGLKEGTITEGIAGEQQKYGNITSLDEKSLEYIALIMGSKVEDMAKMGIGASNPEAIVEAIVDRANELANSGYNSVGQYVGEQQARRELYSYLLKYSPQIADIFATMQEEQHNINSLFRDQADTFAEWKTLVPTMRGGHSPAEYNMPATLGQEWNLVKQILDQIKEGIYISMSDEILALLRKIADWRIGMSEEENQERNEENRKANEEFIKSAQIQLSGLQGDKLTEAEKQRKLALEYFVKKAEKANKGNIKGNISYAVPTDEEIVVRGQDLAKTQLISSTWKQNVVYSTALKNVVDAYVDPSKLSAFEQKEFNKELEERIKAEEEKKKADGIRRYKEASDRVDKNSAYQREIREANAKYTNKYAPSLPNSSISQAQALIKARYMYGAKADFRYDENGKELTLAEQLSLAMRAGYIASSGGITPNYYVENKMIKPVDESEVRENLLADESWQEKFYVDAYNKWWDLLNRHLIGALQGEAVENAREGTPLYDLYVLQKKYGSDLSGLSSKLGEGASGAILSEAFEGSGGTFTHKIIFDLNNNGKVEASDVTLSSYTTNRYSDTGTVVDRVEITNGKVDWYGSPASSVR